mgnify:CR=1 FL=1
MLSNLTSVCLLSICSACVIAAQKGGYEVRKARASSSPSSLDIKVKGKTREGVLDVLTIGQYCRFAFADTFFSSSSYPSLTGDRMSNMAMVNSLLYTFPGVRIISEEHLPTATDVRPIVVSKGLLNSEAFSTIPDDIHLNIEDLVIWIDPLDATKEYAEGLTHFVTTMVCVARRGEPFIGVIHQPFLSKTYWASKFGVDKQLLSLRRAFTSPVADQATRLIISRSHAGDVERLAKMILANATVIEAAGSGYKTLELLKGNADIYLHKTYIKKWDICAPNALLKFATEGELSTLSGETIRYDFESDFVNKDGVFATAKADLVPLREKLAGKLLATATNTG